MIKPTLTTCGTLLCLGIVASVSSTIIQAKPAQSVAPGVTTETNAELKEKALEILEGHCNVCHKKQNPFMVFKAKNMTKRAGRIYKAVFVERRMPKGDQYNLSEKEAEQLKKWVLTEVNQ